MLASLLEAKLVRRIGVSNVNLRQLNEAMELAFVAAVEIALGPFAETSAAAGRRRAVHAAGVEVLAHSPLGGPEKAPKLSRDPSLARVASRHGVTAQRVALQAIADLHPLVVPVAGARRPETVRAVCRNGAPGRGRPRGARATIRVEANPPPGSRSCRSDRGRA